MRLVDATVIAKSPAWGTIRQTTLRAPTLAQGQGAGQFVSLRCGHGPAPLLPRAFWLAGRAAQLGDVSLFYAVAGPATLWLSERPVGATLPALGPCGRPFT